MDFILQLVEYIFVNICLQQNVSQQLTANMYGRRDLAVDLQLSIKKNCDRRIESCSSSPV
jgi:hypothetical protein